MKQTGTLLRRGRTLSFWTRIVPSVILLSAITACSLSQSGATPTGEPAAGQAATARPTVPPSPTPVPEIEGGEVVVVPEIVVPPMDYMEVLEVKVASGEWTYEEGLVMLLKTFAGELNPSEVLGDDQPLADEMGGVVASAYEYLETGTDAAVKEERRLAHFLFNAYWEPLEFELPPVGSDRPDPWRRWIDTALDSPHDIVPWQTASSTPGARYRTEARSVIVLFADLG